MNFLNIQFNLNILILGPLSTDRLRGLQITVTSTTLFKNNNL